MARRFFDSFFVEYLDTLPKLFGWIENLMVVIQSHMKSQCHFAVIPSEEKYALQL